MKITYAGGIKERYSVQIGTNKIETTTKYYFIKNKQVEVGEILLLKCNKSIFKVQILHFEIV